MSNMENKLAIIQRVNVSKFMIVSGIDRKRFCELTGLSSSTFGNSFRLENATTDPSKKTLGLVYKAFGLEPGILNKVEGVTDNVVFTIPVPVEKSSELVSLTTVHMKIGLTVIETQIPDHRAKKLLAYLILGEDL